MVMVVCCSASCFSNIVLAAPVRFSVNSSQWAERPSNDSLRGRLAPEKCGIR